MKKIVTSLKKILNLETDEQFGQLFRVPETVLSRVQSKTKSKNKDLQLRRGLLIAYLLLRRISVGEVDFFKEELVEIIGEEMKKQFGVK